MNIIELNKNDTLILKFKHSISQELARNIKEAFPQVGINIVIIPESVTIEGVIRAN